MRVVLLILILAVVTLIVLIQSGFLSIQQTSAARLPTVEANSSGVTASSGQAPSFEIETGSVAVGSKQQNVTVPTIRVIPGGTANAAASSTPNAR